MFKFEHKILKSYFIRQPDLKLTLRMKNQLYMCHNSSHYTPTTTVLCNKIFNSFFLRSHVFFWFFWTILSSISSFTFELREWRHVFADQNFLLNLLIPILQNFIGHMDRCTVAQMAERLAANRKIRGSNPAWFLTRP